MSDQPIDMVPPPRPSKPSAEPLRAEVPCVDVVIDGHPEKVPQSWTILDACRKRDIDIPTLCYLENLSPVNVCRVCVVEVTGSRVLVPSCSRRVESGMEIQTDSPRVRMARKMVMEFLSSSVDLSTAPEAQKYMTQYDACPERYGPTSTATHDSRDERITGHHHAPEGACAETVAQPVKIDNDLYIRDYSKCILCYKCVQACGTEAQNTFAIAIAGRGFDARISTEENVPLTDSACVYCGNCIAVCPTGALMFKSEFEMRQEGTWDESKQVKTDTICPYCGVGCTLSLHVQDNRIVKVTSPLDITITEGNLCIKGRFGFEHVHHDEPKQSSDSSAE